MPRIVLDASAALRMVLGLESANELAAKLEEAAVVIAPGLFCGEVANGLWKYVSGAQLSGDEALGHLDEAIALVDTFVSDRTLVVEALAEATTHEHPVYDLLYAVLARRHGARILTLDSRLSRLVMKMGVGLA